MSKTALISPSLSYFLQFCVPHQFSHVSCCWLRGVDASCLLPFGHPPPQLVVPVQDCCPPLVTDSSKYGLSSAGSREALVLTHSVLSVNRAVGVSTSRRYWEQSSPRLRLATFSWTIDWIIDWTIDWIIERTIDWKIDSISLKQTKQVFKKSGLRLCRFGACLVQCD